MRCLTITSMLTVLALQAHAQWAYDWARQTSSTHTEHGNSCAVTPDGHVVAGGSFSVELELEGNIWNVAPGNGTGGFVACYNASGTYAWAHAFSYYHPSGGSAEVWDVATDNVGNVFAAGSFSDSLFMDGVKVLDAPDSISPYAHVYYVAKFNPGGVLQWVAPVGVEPYTGQLLAMAVDGNGDAWTVGHGGGDQGHLDKLDGNTGAVLIHETATGAGVYPNDVATDGNNNVYVIGQASNSFTMGGLTCPYNNALGGGSTPLFVGKFNSAGAAQWYYVPDQTGSGYVGFPENNLAVDSVGNSFIETRKYIRINGDTITDGNLHHGMFSLDTNGNVRWARKLNASGQLHVNDLHCDGNGNVLAAGLTADPSIDLIDTVLTEIVNFNIFLGRYDGITGALTGLLFGPSIAELPGLGMGPDDVPVLCGSMAGGPVDLGDVLNGSWDMVVAKLQSTTATTTGSAEVPRSEGGLHVSPDPSDGRFTCRMDGTSGPLQVDVLDDHGAVVHHRESSDPSPTFQLTLPAGLYLVRASDEQGHVACTRMVVR